MPLLEEVVGNRLRSDKLTLAVAESCTGGLLGHRLTNVPGSSDYFLGGVIAYAYEAKVDVLGVSWETLKTYGAVSDETVAEMVVGIRDLLGSDVAISISGIAGPGGGLPNKPVGLVYFGLNVLGTVTTRHAQFDGSREMIKAQAAEAALNLLMETLEEGGL